MRVICIDKEAYPEGIYGEESDFLNNGESYIVVDVYFDEGYIWYVLEGDESVGYWEKCFCRTSDIDEKEMNRDYEIIKIKQ